MKPAPGVQAFIQRHDARRALIDEKRSGGRRTVFRVRS